MFFLYLCLLLITSNLVNCDQGSVKNGQCGGTIELDDGVLSYPGESVVSPGQICIWTIHLKTRLGFRYRFLNSNIPGGGLECPRTSVGVFSLSNTIPGDMQGNKICNENLYTGDYAESGNLLTVIFRIDEITWPNDVSFTLEWEGSQVTGNPPKHTSTFTSISGGIVQYPIQGEYAPNSVLTWLVQPQVLTDLTDITIDSVSLEQCNFGDPCLCDSLIIYSVTPSGSIEVGDKFCGEREGGQLTLSGGNFIAVFYTDLLEDPGVGYGFRMIWKTGQEITTLGTTTRPTSTSTTTTPSSTTTPTTYPTTTEDPNNIPTIGTCGGSIEANHGKIIYKYNETYENNERCAWIIRSPDNHMNLELIKPSSGFEIGYDYLSIFAFDTYESDSTVMGIVTNYEERRSLYGPVAVVVFTSSTTGVGQGFELDFRFEGSTSTLIKYHQDFYSQDVEGSYQIGGRELDDHYGNSQLSVFVMSRNNTYFSDIGWTAQIRIYKIEEYDSTLDPCFHDGIRVYSVAADSLSFVGKYCSNSETVVGPFLARNLYIFVFATDSGTDMGGFNIEWKLR